MGFDLRATATNPVPQGGECEVLTSRDGLPLRLALFPSVREAPRGCVTLVPGRTECIERYFETVEDLRRRGFAVAVADPRGQGLSVRQVPGRLGHVNSYGDFVDDLSIVMARARARFKGPYIVLGHSMGGHIVLKSFAANPWLGDRMVLLAPFMGFGTSVGMKEWQIDLFSFMFGLAGYEERPAPGSDGAGRSLELFEGNVLTSDPQRFGRWRTICESWPELFTGAPTVGWIRASLLSMKELRKARVIEAIGCPALVSCCLDDSVVSVPQIGAVAKRLPDCRLLEIAGARHEILQERDELRGRFLTALDAFLADLQSACP